MSFNQYNDTPNQIRNEGEQISVKFKRNGDGTGTITWNIPTAPNGILKYVGALITLDTSETSVAKWPTDSVRYNEDNTCNPNLHVGDKINTALVVGVVMHPTNSLIVNDVDPTKSYFITLHAFTDVLQYHFEGVHSYSTSNGGNPTPDTPATQGIIVGNGEVGIYPNDLTGLDPLKVYDIDVLVDNDQKVSFSFLGSSIQTYQDFIDQWNLQIKLLNSPLQSPFIPNTNTYYYNANLNELSQWNGNIHVPITPVVKHDSQPNIPIVGSVWFNPVSNVTFEAINSGLSIVWTPVNVIKYSKDPLQIPCGGFWFNNTDMYKWTGSVWHDVTLFNQQIDPALPIKLPCDSYWFNEKTSELLALDAQCKAWKPTIAQLSTTDPTLPVLNHLWFNDSTNILNKFDGVAYVSIPVAISDTQPTTVPFGQHWYKPSTMQLYINNSGVFSEETFLLWHLNPLVPPSGVLWWNPTTDTLWRRDGFTNSWVQIISFTISDIDPLLPPNIPIGSMWTSDGATFKLWDGSEWKTVEVLIHNIDPHNIVNGTYWRDTSTNRLYIRNNPTWTLLDPIVTDDDPYIPTVGDFWFNTTTSQLNVYNGSAYTNVLYSTQPLTPIKGFTYFNTSTNQLQQWNGLGWIEPKPKFTVSFAQNNTHILLQSSAVGSTARVDVGWDKATPFNATVFNQFKPALLPLQPKRGGDGLTGIPTYAQLGVGTDGSSDERREMIDSVRHQLGYPMVEVELTNQQLNYAVDDAIETLRQRSGIAYKRGYWFLQIEPRQQKYILTDKRIGYNKIVSVVEIHRLSSAFLSNSEGQGVYGQIALQQLYHMGSFDLISYHLVAQYISTMRNIFASQIMFDWNEDTRTLSIFKDLHKRERVLMEVVVERTEQDLFKDRYAKQWLQDYATAKAMQTLVNVRGKYASLPGSGGGVMLNANDLSARADTMILDLYEQIDNYIVNNPEEWGAGSNFTFG